jgi:hypothetical protein
VFWIWPLVLDVFPHLRPRPCKVEWELDIGTMFLFFVMCRYQIWDHFLFLEIFWFRQGGHCVRLYGNRAPCSHAQYRNRKTTRFRFYMVGVELKLEPHKLNEYSKTRLKSARTRTLMSRAELTFLACYENEFHESICQHLVSSY